MVMYDTRDVVASGNYSYWNWAAKLNFQYARTHGYDFIFSYGQSMGVEEIPDNVTVESDGINSIYKTKHQCTLRRPGKPDVPRSAPWCKLLAVAAALECGYDTVVFIDSDGYLKTDAPSIDAIITTYGNGHEDGEKNSDWASPVVWFASNEPWQWGVPNSAFHIWKSSPDAWRLLRQWWQQDTSAMSHAYEQGGLHISIRSCKHFQRTHIYRTCGVGVLKMPWCERNMWGALPMVHVTSSSKYRRAEMIEVPSRSVNISPAELNDTRKTLETKRLEYLLGMDENNTWF